MRSVQYDTVSDRYGRYLPEEVLTDEVAQTYKLRPGRLFACDPGAPPQANLRLQRGLVSQRPVQPRVVAHRQLRGAAMSSRDYDPTKTAQIYEMEEAEHAKPVFRVKIGNRDPW